jgi:hypothetical protein
MVLRHRWLFVFESGELFFYAPRHGPLSLLQQPRA